MSTPEPTFGEDDVRADFENTIEYGLVSEVGVHGRVRDYNWAADEDDEFADWPFVVVRDGREFEVDIMVTVTELTPERMAARQADHERLLAAIERYKADR